MANTVDIQTIRDDARNLVIRVYLASDGATGDLAATTLVTASGLNGVPDTLKLVRVHSAITGFQAKLLWDATTDDELIHLSADAIEADFCHFGGIPNPKSTGSTGNVNITTTGFAAAGDEGYFVLEFQK